MTVRAAGLPDEGHGLAKRPNKLDAYPKAMAFLARHLAG